MKMFNRKNTSGREPTHSVEDNPDSLQAELKDLKMERDRYSTPEQPKRRSRRKFARKGRKSKKNELHFDDELDPYDSDPGEAYRDHCEKIRGISTKSCLHIPFRKQKKRSGADDEIHSESTAPPSPLNSEQGDDVLTQPPISFRKDRTRYSVRTEIGDGSTQQVLGETAMQRRDIRPNGISMNVSHWSDKGARAYMEDRFAVEDLGIVQVEVSPVAVRGSSVEVTYEKPGRQNPRVKMPLSWFAVFDGHGGDKASQYCCDWLSSYVREEESFPYDLGYAMKKSYAKIDEDFTGTSYPDGTTACAVLAVGGRRVVCANAGDSRAIVVRKDGSVVRLSRDHKPGMPDETRRITDLGGRVVYWGRWRVEGLLAVSRSVGDASLKPYVTSEPEVCEYDISKDDWFMIVGSDGIWDVLDNEEAAHVVIATSCVIDDGEMLIDTDRFKWAARNLCDHAISCGSTDNISVICVDLQSCDNPDAIQGRYLPSKLSS